MEITTCTRPQPHSGPCNGWPCPWRRFTIWLKDWFNEVQNKVVLGRMSARLAKNIRSESELFRDRKQRRWR